MKSASKTSKGKGLAPTLPAVCNLFIADDIRIEQNGKPSLIGFYPDSVLVVQMPADRPDPTEDKAARIPGISILAFIKGVIGEYGFELEMTGAGGVHIARSDRTKLVLTKETINFVVRIMPMPIVGFGMYEVVLKLDGHPYKFPFEVRRGAPSLEQAEQMRFMSPLKGQTQAQSKSREKRSGKVAARRSSTSSGSAPGGSQQARARHSGRR